MKNLLLATALVAAGSLCLESSVFAHGGQYRGPGDTVPPGGGGPGGGGPNSPGPGGPSSPGPSGPSSPGPGGPGSPGGGGSGPAAPTTGGGGGGDVDLTAWTFWWEFNKEPYLNLKSHIHEGQTETGTTGFFLGQGQKAQGKDSLRPTEEQIRQKVVPALLRALETESNNDIVTGCLVALAKIGDAKDEAGDSAFEGVIRKRLSDSVQEISETAAVSLGILANDKSIGLLQQLLEDAPEGRTAVGAQEVNYRTRAFAAYGLGLIGARTGDDANRQKIVNMLAKAIETDDTKTRDLKVACLVALGLVPVETIEAPVVEEGQPVDVGASREGLLSYVFEFLQNEDNHYLVRAHCPTALVRLLAGLPAEQYDAWKARIAEDLIERCSKRSKDQNEVQQSAVLALGLLGDVDKDEIDAKIRKALEAVPKDLSDQQSRNFSMIAMAKAGGRPGSGDLEGITDASKFLLGQLAKGSQTVQPWAGIAIGVMGHALSEAKVNHEAVVSMASALRSTLEEEKSTGRIGAYAIGLGILRDAEAATVLREKLKRISDDEARGYMSVALGLMNDRVAVSDIQAIVAESKYRPELLKQAAIALGLLGDKELVPKLIEMLTDAKSLATQAALSSALGFIGDQRSIDPLVQMLENKDLTPRARGFAAVALGIVADKEVLPWNTKIAVDLNYRASTQTLNDQEGTGILNIL